MKKLNVSWFLSFLFYHIKKVKGELSHLGNCGDVVGMCGHHSAEGQSRLVFLVRLQVEPHVGSTHLPQQLTDWFYYTTWVCFIYESSITLTLYPECWQRHSILLRTRYVNSSRTFTITVTTLVSTSCVSLLYLYCCVHMSNWCKNGQSKAGERLPWGQRDILQHLTGMGQVEGPLTVLPRNVRRVFVSF